MKLEDFAGRWQIDRQIDDRLAGRQGRLVGEAVFSPDAGGLVYEETGRLSFAGQPPLQARQSYLWRADGPAIVVDFADGRPFHRFDPAMPCPAADHWCAPDAYRVAYDFAAWSDAPAGWQATWTVRGPRKDYTMTTRYRRPGGPR